MTFSKEIIEILDYIGSKFGIAIDWTSDNVMPYLQSLCEKYIQWEIATSAAWIIGMILLTGLCFLIAYVGRSIYVGGSIYLDDIMIRIGVLIGIIGIAVISFQAYDIISAITFPELKIYDFLKLKMGQM